MSAMSDYRASSGSLTPPSASPSPPPIPQSRKPPSTAKSAGLDSSSELSELTEDEQDASRASTHSDTPQDNGRVARKKRGGIVPAPMWDWAYNKTTGRKAADSEEPISAVSKKSNHVTDAPTGSSKDSNDGDGDDDEAPVRQPMSDADDSGERPVDHDSEDEDADPSEKPASLAVSSIKNDTRESSTALTEEDDVGSLSDDFSMESEEDLWRTEPENQQDEEELSANTPYGDDVDDNTVAKNADTMPVVPLAPAGSSIMAGQQLIKTPSASPSTSPELEEDARNDPARSDASCVTPEKAVKTEPAEPEAGADVGAAVDNDNDNENAEDVENAEQVDQDVEQDADVEAEAEAEVEEAEVDLQPAHRAEALDVLAQIELRFALVREALYVEKMEDLAMEEAMVLQGLHPEMIHLQTELQIRHDKRLELAAKKRQYEDDHVSLMHKVEENSIWSFWKYERDALQTELFAGMNRKKRRLEREKRFLDRPPPARCIPQPPSGRMPMKPISVRELVKSASVDADPQRSKLKRKRKEPADQGYAYPTLSVLSIQEIQTDLQVLTAPRARSYHAPVIGEIGPGVGVRPPFDQHYVDYNAPPGMGMPNPGHTPFGHGLPPAPLSVHAYAAPPQPQSRFYHQQQPGPPMGSIHHPGSRAMQGPGAPPMGGYPLHGALPLRRTPSPSSYEHGGMANGGLPYGGMTGPGQHWAPVPPNTGLSSSAGAGPSKQPTVNGYGKDHRRSSANGVKDGQVFDMREIDNRVERERERAGMWHENGIKEAQEEHVRMHAQHAAPLQQSQHPHRHTPMHQSLQGVPHHHHVVHRHSSHHHHPPSSSGSTRGSAQPVLRPLAGPGTRPDGPPNARGHGLEMGHSAYPGASSLAGPAQPLLPHPTADSGHMVPPKMTSLETEHSVFLRSH